MPLLLAYQKKNTDKTDTPPLPLRLLGAFGRIQSFGLKAEPFGDLAMVGFQPLGKTLPFVGIPWIPTINLHLPLFHRENGGRKPLG